MIGLRSSLSSKLSLAILLLAVPFFVLSLGILFVQSSNFIKEEASENAHSLLDITSQRISRYVNTIETGTNSCDWLVMEYMQPDSILALSHRIVSQNPHIDGCSISFDPFVFPKLGRYFSVYTIMEGDSVTSVVEEQYEYFEKKWYRIPKERGEPCWVVYYDEADSLELTLDGMLASYCKPLYLGDRFIGVISTDLSLLKLSEMFAAEKPYPNSYFMMIDEDGRYYIHPDGSMLFEKTIFTDADPRIQPDLVALGHEMTSGKSGSMAVGIDGVPCIVCYSRVPGTTWSLALVSPESDILQSYHQLVYIIVVLIALGLLAILLLTHRVVAHAIMPINQLLRKSYSVASGNYEVYIPRSRRIDAVGRLQNSFATMLERLNFHMGSVRYTAEQTEHRNDELVRATRLAEEADRQKTVFIQNLSHQIRTPLNIIMGFTEILHSNARMMPEEEQKTVTTTLRHNSMLLFRIVMMLFDSSETGAKKEEADTYFDDVVSCNEIGRICIDFVKDYYPLYSISFETTVPDDLCLNTNYYFLMITLRELLFNACKYSDGQHIALRIEETPSSIRYIIEDTGPGIAEEQRDLMFEPFTKLNDLSEGLGLGLPLSRRHARHLGGDLTLDTSYNDGCRLIVQIPKSRG